MPDWIHPNDRRKGGCGDPLLDFKHRPTPTLTFRCSQLTKEQYQQVLDLVESFEQPEEDNRTYVSVRETNCMSCRKPGRCEVTFTYTEGGKVQSAEVTRLEDGWKQLPYGDAGGVAPYCPVCQEEL